MNDLDKRYSGVNGYLSTMVTTVLPGIGLLY